MSKILGNKVLEICLLNKYFLQAYIVSGMKKSCREYSSNNPMHLKQKYLAFVELYKSSGEDKRFITTMI